MEQAQPQRMLITFTSRFPGGWPAVLEGAARYCFQGKQTEIPKDLCDAGYDWDYVSACIHNSTLNAWASFHLAEALNNNRGIPLKAIDPSEVPPQSVYPDQDYAGRVESHLRAKMIHEYPLTDADFEEWANMPIPAKGCRA